MKTKKKKKSKISAAAEAAGEAGDLKTPGLRQPLEGPAAATAEREVTAKGQQQKPN